MKLWKVRIHFIAKEIFQFALIAYLILSLAEMFKQGFVSNFFNINILLAIVLLSSFVMGFTHNELLDEALKIQKQQKLKTRDFEYIIIIAAGSAFLVWFKTQDLGILSIVISVFTAVIIVLLSLLVFIDKE